MSSSRCRDFLAGLIVTTFASTAAYAVPQDFTFSGNFSHDNDVLTFHFSVAAPSQVTVFSSSWQSSNGGGFDPILSLYDSSGSVIASQDDGGLSGSQIVNGTSYSYGVWDSYYVVNLAAGSYFIAVTQYANFPNTTQFADGFSQDGNPNFTFDNGYGGATQPFFNGVWDNNDPRTSFWRFHILNVESAEVEDPNEVPEPATLALVGGGLLALGALRRRRAGQ